MNEDTQASETYELCLFRDFGVLLFPGEEKNIFENLIDSYVNRYHVIFYYDENLPFLEFFIMNNYNEIKERHNGFKFCDVYKGDRLFIKNIGDQEKNFYIEIYDTKKF